MKYWLPWLRFFHSVCVHPSASPAICPSQVLSPFPFLPPILSLSILYRQRLNRGISNSSEQFHSIGLISRSGIFLFSCSCNNSISYHKSSIDFFKFYLLSIMWLLFENPFKYFSYLNIIIIKYYMYYLPIHYVRLPYFQHFPYSIISILYSIFYTL